MDLQWGFHNFDYNYVAFMCLLMLIHKNTIVCSLEVHTLM